MATDITRPHPEYSRWAPVWAFLDDVIAGTSAIKAKGPAYLPVLEGQSGPADPAYQNYLQRAPFYAAVDRTIAGLIGMLLRHPLVLRAPKPVTDLFDRLDLRNDLSAVVQMILRAVLGPGRVGLFVEWQDRGRRPFVAIYDTTQILNWRTAVLPDGSWDLCWLVLAETVTDADRDVPIEQWREIALVDGVVTVSVWRRPSVGAGRDLVLVDEVRPVRRGQPLTRIPFITIGPRGSIDPTPQKPPLLDVADLCVQHYRLGADLAHALHFASLPTPYVTGWQGAPAASLAIGSGAAWIIPGEGASVGMLEVKGDSIPALERALAHTEALMGTLGARLLEQQPRAAETAEAVRLRTGGDVVTLGTMAASVSAGLTMALRWCGWWLSLDDLSDISAEVNSDFVDATLSPQASDALLRLWQSGAISRATLYANLVAGEIAREGVPLAEEVATMNAEESLPEVAS